MRGVIRPWLMFCCVCLAPVSAVAEVVRAEIGKETAWTGEAVPLFVTLYSPGPFSGSASFDLPQLSRTVIVKAGNPVVGNQTVDGQSYFYQRHEFTIFTQNAGDIGVPGFRVRFAGKQSFVSAPETIEGITPAVRFQSKRPPGTANMGIVVAATRMDVTQTWNPQAMTAVTVGDVIERTITRRAIDTTAMMLLPVSADAPEGVRVYVAEPVVEDHVERGVSKAERHDTIKYQFQRPGSYLLPSISLVWWDPQVKKLREETLAGATVTITGTREAAAAADAPVSQPSLAILGLTSLTMLVAGWWLYKPARKRWKRWQTRHQNPEVVAVRRLRSACRASDAPGAYAALVQWLRIVSAREGGPRLDELLGSVHVAEFRNEWKALSEHIYAETVQSPWSGRQLAETFSRARHELSQTRQKRRERFALPPLNPAPAIPPRCA
jgi:hypothetical protein